MALDISGKMIARARERCPEVAFFRCDCENPAFALPDELVSGRFDIILGVNTFSYYPSKALALAR